MEGRSRGISKYLQLLMASLLLGMSAGVWAASATSTAPTGWPLATVTCNGSGTQLSCTSTYQQIVTSQLGHNLSGTPVFSPPVWTYTQYVCVSGMHPTTFATATECWQLYFTAGHQLQSMGYIGVDSDNDRIPAVIDNCDDVANANQLDTDGDAQGNVCDADDDNDGLSDVEETVQGTNPLLIDSDGDAVNDPEDDFPTDGCAIADTDNDGLPNTLEPKGNCLIDGFETGNFTGAGNAWVNSGPWVVTTGGRADNYAARQPGGWYVTWPYLRLSYTTAAPSTLIFYYKNQNRTYGGGPPQYFTVDGANTVIMYYPIPWTKVLVPLTAGNHTLQWNGKTCDTVYCGATDIWVDDIGVTTLVQDADDDNDGTMDTLDKFPLNAAASSDSDNDGHPGSWNTSCDAACQLNSGLTLDNCPSSANLDQLNTDGDTQGNTCDWDDDNDGVPDNIDAAPLNSGDVSEITLPLDTNYKGLQLKGTRDAAP